MLSTNYKNQIIDICCRMISTDGEVSLQERIWMVKLCDTNEKARRIRDEMLKANYPIVGDPNALFEDPELSKAELLVAGMINGLTINACFPNAGFGNFESGNGGAYVSVNWQIYSTLDREVIYSVTTEGSYEANSSSDLIFDIFTTSFARATQNLLADRGFHNLVVRPKDFLLEYLLINSTPFTILPH